MNFYPGKDEIKDILKIEADGIFDRDWELESI